jgi:hypothetical protein
VSHHQPTYVKCSVCNSQIASEGYDQHWELFHTDVVKRLAEGTYGQALPKVDWEQADIPNDEEYYIVDWRNKKSQTALSMLANSFQHKVRHSRQ